MYGEFVADRSHSVYKQCFMIIVFVHLLTDKCTNEVMSNYKNVREVLKL